MTDYFYRVEETTYSAGVNEWGDPLPGGPTRTNLNLYRVHSHTPCGVWLDDGCGQRWRFICNKWAKRFACPTVEEAIASFHARKKRQVALLNAQIRRAQAAVRYLDTCGFYIDGRKWLS